MEHLVTVLSEIVKKPLKNSFDQEIIVVQNRGMQRWLTMELSSELGIWANCRYPFPSAFIHDLFKATIPEAVDNLQFDPDILVWKILHNLPDLLSIPSFKPIATYLEDSDPVKLFQLSRKIADLFDQYTIYRPEMVLQWEIENENHWQAHLWRTIFPQGKITPQDTFHRAKLKQAFLNRLNQKSIDTNLFPERVSIFGISALPPFYVELFNAISSITEVNFFVLNPCAEYWDDILSEKEINRILSRNYKTIKIKSDDKKLHFDLGNSLLSSWGRFGRDFLTNLHEYCPEEYSLPVNPEKPILLSKLQSDILNLIERGNAENPPFPIEKSDHSIQIHSCHSPMREVEVLYDNLLNLFRLDPDLKPSDIIVMSPDIQTYAPFINAVFGSVSQMELKIPFSLADLGLNVESIVTKAFASLLEIPGSRFTVSSIIDLLEIRQIQSSFNISEEEIQIIKNWILESGIRWGIDKSSKDSLNLPAFDENTWSYGLNRLLLGFSLPSEDKFSFFDIAGYDNIEGSQSETLGNVLDFVESLVEFNSKSAVKHTLQQWSEILLWLLNRFFKVDQNEENDILLLRNTILELSSVANALNYKDEIHFDIVKNWIGTKLKQQSFRPGFITGTVTFCAMLPMRSIPFKIVCIIGLNDSFPRHGNNFSWNMISSKPRIGDHCLDQEDRYLFLEALLSARDLFYVSYIGQSPQDNVARQSSVLIEELLDYLDKSFYFKSIDDQDSNRKINRDKRECSEDNITDSIKSDYVVSMRNSITTKHYLQAFNQTYFIKDSNLFSFSEDNFKASLKVGSGNDLRMPFFSEPLPSPDESFKSLQIIELIRFFQNPSRFILNKRSGITLENRTEQFSDDEPFDLKGIDHYKSAERLLNNLMNGESIENCYNQLKRNGFLPHGTVGKFHYDQLSRNVNDFLNDLSNLHNTAALENLFVDNVLGDFHITGIINNIRKMHFLHFKFAFIKASELLNAWIRHLIINCFKTDGYPLTSILISRDRSIRFKPVEDSEKILLNLLNLYWTGLSTPLQFFPNSSLEYAEQVVVKGKPEDYAFKIALKTWEGNDFSVISAESEDPYHKLCFRSSEQIGDDFKKYSIEVFQPLIAHLEEMEISK